METFDIRYALEHEGVFVIGGHNGKGRTTGVADVATVDLEFEDKAEFVEECKRRYFVGGMDRDGGFWMLADGPMLSDVAEFGVQRVPGRAVEEALEATAATIRAVLLSAYEIAPSAAQGTTEGPLVGSTDDGDESESDEPEQES